MTTVDKKARKHRQPFASDWAVVEFDRSLNVALMSDGFREIFKLSGEEQPSTLRDILAMWSEKKWISVDQTLAGETETPCLIVQVQENIVLTAFLISPSNRIVIATFIKNVATNHLKLSCVDTQLHVEMPSAAVQDDVEKVLHTLYQVYFFRPQIATLLPEIQIWARRLRSLRHFFAAREKFILLPRSRMTPEGPTELDLEIDSLAVQCVDMARECEINHASQVRVVQTNSGRTVVVSVKYAPLGRNGPGFVYGFIAPLSDIVSRKHVGNAFPDFTKKEVEAITALLQGHTIKEAATILEKSPVTVALQARSALNKTDHVTLERFLIHTLLEHIQLN